MTQQIVSHTPLLSIEAPLQHDAPADTSNDAVTYGYIRSHMRRHQRITTLITLCPGNDYLEGTPCDSEADAAERADGMGIVLVETGVIEDMVEVRRAAQITTLRQYMEQDARQKRQNEAVQHETSAMGSVEKGDIVRIATRNAHVPFVGRVEKLVADPETGRRPALETSTNGVANLTAHVEVYEAPFAWDAEMAEVDTEELVAIDCLVEVKLPYQTAFLGRVVGVLHATREAQVWKLNSPKEHWYSMDYMRVIWTADVANEAYGWNEEALASTEVEVSA